MRVQVLSDLHLNFGHKKLPAISKDAEVLVYAGDTTPRIPDAVKYFQHIRQSVSVPIIFVMGNHDYWYKLIGNAVSEYRNALSVIPDLNFLEQDIVEIDGYRFVGTTMWTDFDNGRCSHAARRGMLDCPSIYKRTSEGKTNINNKDIVIEHVRAKTFLQNALALEIPKTIVVTHHGPSLSLIDESYAKSAMNGAFYADMADLILKHKPLAWLYGHTHVGRIDQIGDTKTVCNPFGYTHEKYLGYTEQLVIDF